MWIFIKNSKETVAMPDSQIKEIEQKENYICITGYQKTIIKYDSVQHAMFEMDLFFKDCANNEPAFVFNPRKGKM